MNNFGHNLRNRDEGFTLIELLVALSIFTIVMTIALGSLFTIISANKRARALHLTMDNLHFAIDEMTRDIRTGTDYVYSGAGTGTDCSELFVFSFVSSDGSTDVEYKCQEDASQNGQLQKRTGGSGDWISVTAPEIDVSTFRIYNRSTQQPRALVLIAGEASADRNVEVEFNLQTTVSQRKLNIVNID